MSNGLVPVLWAAPSIEKPGEEVVLAELDPATGLCRAFEGRDGTYEPVSVATEQRRILEKAKLWLQGDPATLGDARVPTAMAAVFVSLFEKGTDPARSLALPKKKENL